MEGVRLDRTDDGIGWLRFESGRPGNAITRGTLGALAERVDEVAGSSLHVLVLTGAPDAFANGADLDEMAALDRDGFAALMEVEFALFHAVEELPQATVAAIAGPCSGNGAELVLACDLRVATRSARIGLPEARLGFTGPAGRLSRFVGYGAAKDILLTGRSVGADEALGMGLVTMLVEDGQLEAQAARLAGKLARVPAGAVAATKAHVAEVYRTGTFDERAMMAAALDVFETPELQATMARLVAPPAGDDQQRPDAAR